ncbi:hypothetical protein SEEN593_10746, partial [Salmonella enterica subsp. enterica serovar Newport str. CVM 19593]
KWLLNQRWIISLSPRCWLREKIDDFTFGAFIILRGL